MKMFRTSLKVIFLTTVCGTLLFSGCSKQGSGSGASANTGGIVELTMFLDFSWLPDSFTVWEQGRVTKEVMEKTGVKLNITRAKTGDHEQLNLLLASDDLPDFIVTDSFSPIAGTLYESDAVADLMPLIKQYAPELIDIMGQEYWNFYKSDSGINNYYANCAFSPKSGEKYAAFGGWCQAFVARQDIWEALGEPDISTPEKLLQHLKDVKTKYPTIKPLLVGAGSLEIASSAGGGISHWRTDFGIETYYEKSDGSITASYNNPEYVNFITWLNELYRLGFITREELAGTDDSLNAMKEQGNIYLLTASDTFFKYPPAGNPDVMYVAVPPMEKFYGTQQTGIAWCSTFISKKCKNPEAAIKLVSYLASNEGDRLAQWGQEGVDYEFNANGAPVATAWYNEINATPNNSYAIERGTILFSMNWADHEWVTLNIGEEEPFWHRARALYQDHFYGRLNFLSLNPTGSITESIVFQQCNDYFQETLPKIIMAGSRNEAVSLFNEMKNTLTSMGIGDVEKYWTAKSNKIKAAFGEDKLRLKGADSVVYHNLYD
jgi:putative aldouronate transport system substrate-binding protein